MTTAPLPRVQHSQLRPFRHDLGDFLVSHTGTTLWAGVLLGQVIWPSGELAVRIAHVVVVQLLAATVLTAIRRHSKRRPPAEP